MLNWRAGPNGLLTADRGVLRLIIEAPARFLGEFRFTVLRRSWRQIGSQPSNKLEVSGGRLPRCFGQFPPALKGHSRVRPLFVWAAVLLGSGCTLLTASPPQVEVQQVELRGGGLLDQTLAVSLCVTNSNDAELAFRRVVAAVDVSGVPLASSANNYDVRLPPRSSVLVPFTVVTTARNLGRQVLGVLRTGGVDYRMHGTVQLAGALAITLPFSRSGRLDLLTAGGDLLADAAVPKTTRCETERAPTAF